MGTNARNSADSPLIDSGQMPICRLNVRRLCVLTYLHRCGESAALGDVASAIASLDHFGFDSTADGDERYRTFLHHYDLPLLSRLGFVSYDVEERTVTMTDIGRSIVDPR